VDGKHRVEEVGKADAMSLGDQAEHGAVAVKTPGPTSLGEIEALFIISIEQFVCHFAGGRLVGKFEGLGAKPLHADYRDEAVRQETPYCGVGVKIFESNHSGPLLETLVRLAVGRLLPRRLTLNFRGAFLQSYPANSIGSVIFQKEHTRLTAFVKCLKGIFLCDHFPSGFV